MKRLVFAVTALSLLSGCAVLGLDKKKPTTPTVGARIAVLGAESAIQVDPNLAAAPVTLPAMTQNDAWAQPGGNASKSVGHLALGSALAQAWAASIGQGSTNRGRLAAPPVVAAGRVYTVDTAATLRAFDASSGRQAWAVRIGDPREIAGGRSLWNGESTGNSGALFGGGVSYDNGRVYATNGLGDAAAFDAATGAQIWRVRPGGPLRGAPTIANDNVYVVSQDNQLYALNPANGALRWNGIGTLEQAGVFGSAAPAAGQGTVVAGFSSGELTAYRYENGRVVWQDALARTSISTAVSSLSDIDAEPVIHEGRVYAIGQGGRMVALELATGQRIWEINVAGIATPAVVGDWIFVVTDEAQLLALSRETGRVRWISQLRRYEKQKGRKGSVSWVGPVVAGGRLILANSEGQVVNVSPVDGSVQSVVDTKTPISLAPVVAGGTLFILNDRGQLTAWR
jgi:outer membrane protein assembly factor BamB